MLGAPEICEYFFLTHKARYTLATELNSTRSTFVETCRFGYAHESTVSATVDFVADLLPVSAAVDFQQS